MVLEWFESTVASKNITASCAGACCVVMVLSCMSIGSTVGPMKADCLIQAGSSIWTGNWCFLISIALQIFSYAPLASHVNFRVAYAPGMPGTFSPAPRVSDADMHHGTCVTHVLWCMPGSLTSCFLWSWWRGKHSRRMCNPQVHVSGKRPMSSHPRWWPRHQPGSSLIGWVERMVRASSIDK